MKVKVAFFVAGLNAGGIENYLLRFLTQYRNEIDATVYCKSGKIGDLETEYRSINVNIIRFKVGYFNFKNIMRLKKELSKNNYNAVVDFTGNFGGIPMLLSKTVGISKRIVWHRNADDKFKKIFIKNFYNKIVHQLVLNNATDILSNSIAAFDYFYKDYKWLNDNRFEVIYNGLDAENFLSTKENLRKEFNIPSDAFVVGNVGRLNEQKNHITAIQVAIEICKQNKDIYFVFCGKGVDKEYQNLIDQHKLSNQIILTGIRRDIIKVLNTLDCFYFPSILEGQPNALIEAMVVGIPFVSSDIDPVKETVPEDLHSYLLPPLDVEKAKESILRIKDDFEFRNKFIVNEWAIHNFNAKIQFEKFYKKILK